MRSESDELKPKIKELAESIRHLCEEVAVTLRDAEALRDKIDPLLREAEILKQDTTPVWDDSYNLCGNLKCRGDCRICQEGEEDYEEDYSEKYCKRGRR